RDLLDPAGARALIDSRRRAPPPRRREKSKTRDKDVRMHIDGACLCGGVSYSAEVDPARVIICHCTDCQTISGGPYRVNVPVLAENFAVRGEPAVYPKRGGSGETVDTAFCP